MSLRDALTCPGLPEELTRLGIRTDDLATVSGWATEVAKDEDDLVRLTTLVDRLRALVDHPERQDEVFDDGDARHRLGRGVLPLLALVLAAPAVRKYHQQHEIPVEVTDATLADLGQQVWKDRQVNGSTGLHNHEWLTHIWTGRFARLGRLQFELTISDVGILSAPVPVMAIHVDESGPLWGDEVDASLRTASTFFEEHFGEVGPIDWFICESWLLDPALMWRMPDSNLADFARRFTIWQSVEKDRDALYFGFGIEPTPGAGRPTDLDSLSADTRLRRAVMELWRDGEHAMLCRGRLPVISDLT